MGHRTIMKASEKVLIGGVGALMPIILNLLVIDFNTLHDGLTSLSILGYCVRVAVLFGVGGMVAYFHKSERNAFKLFQLGLGAPAVLLAMLNGVNAQRPADAPSDHKVAPGQSWRWDLVSAAEAAETPDEQPAKTFDAAAPSAVEQFLQGFLGRRPNQVWFVISGSHLTRDAARKQAGAINTSGKDLKAEVYAPFGDTDYYAVVIGAGLSKEEALTVRQKAIQKGLPKDTYLWALPEDGHADKP
jgi:hypothetical protein